MKIRLHSAPLLAVVALVGCLTASAQTTTGLLFVPINPCRVADTRNAAGPFGGPPISGGSSRSFAIPFSSCNIPSTTAAYSLNVAVVPHEPLGYLTAWPTGQPQPLVATTNSVDGRVKSSAAIVPTGAAGAVSFFASNTTDVVIDINGYFVSPSANANALAFYAVTPCRVVDTRNASSPLGGPSLTGGQTRTFPLLSSACNLPPAAQAYSLNFAAVPKAPLGYLTAWPAGQVQPLAATLNAVTSTVTANAAIVPAGSSGGIDVFASNDTDLVIDVNGYFAPPGQPGALSLYSLTPCRVNDTRQSAGSQPFSGTLNVNVPLGACAAPGAQAYVFNATAVPPGPLGYLTMWPQGTSQPLVATLNAVDGAVTNNLAIVPANSGSVSAYASNPTQLVLDIFGFFSSSASLLDNPAPTLTSISPTSAEAGSGPQTLMAIGNSFLPSSVVSYNGIAHATTYVSGNELTATLTAADQLAGGDYPVTVVNQAPGGGASNAADLTVNNPLPALFSLSPSAVTVGAAAQTLTIAGSGFVPTSRVTFNGLARPATFVNATQLTIQLAATDQAAAGTYLVVVSNPSPSGGTSNPVAFGVIGSSAAGPSISSISPASGPPLTIVTLYGAFDPSSPPWITFSNQAGYSATVPAEVTGTTSAIAAVPVFQNGSATPLTGALSVQAAFQSGSASNSVPFTLAPIPSLSALPVGTVTEGFLEGEVTALQNYRHSILGTSLDTPDFEAAYTDMLNSAGEVSAAINSIAAGSGTASLGTYDAASIEIGLNDLARSDSLLLSLLHSLAAMPLTPPAASSEQVIDQELSPGTTSSYSAASAIQGAALNAYNLGITAGTTTSQFADAISNIADQPSTATDPGFPNEINLAFAAGFGVGHWATCPGCRPSNTNTVLHVIRQLVRIVVKVTWVEGCFAAGPCYGLNTATYVTYMYYNVYTILKPLDTHLGGPVSDANKALLEMEQPSNNQICSHTNCGAPGSFGGNFTGQGSGTCPNASTNGIPTPFTETLSGQLAVNVWPALNSLGSAGGSFSGTAYAIGSRSSNCADLPASLDLEVASVTGSVDARGNLTMHLTTTDTDLTATGSVTAPSGSGTFTESENGMQFGSGAIQFSLQPAEAFSGKFTGQAAGTCPNLSTNHIPSPYTETVSGQVIADVWPPLASFGSSGGIFSGISVAGGTRNSNCADLPPTLGTGGNPVTGSVDPSGRVSLSIQGSDVSLAASGPITALTGSGTFTESENGMQIGSGTIQFSLAPPTGPLTLVQFPASGQTEARDLGPAWSRKFAFRPCNTDTRLRCSFWLSHPSVCQRLLRRPPPDFPSLPSIPAAWPIRATPLAPSAQLPSTEAPRAAPPSPPVPATPLPLRPLTR